MDLYYRENYKQTRKGWGQEYTFATNDFSGGLNNKSADAVMDDKQVRDCRNMIFEEKSLLAKRNGIDLVSEDAMPNNVRYVADWEAINAKVFITTQNVIIKREYEDDRTVNIWNTTYTQGDIVTGCEFRTNFFIADSNNLWVIDKNLNVWLCDDNRWMTTIISTGQQEDDDPGEYHLDYIQTTVGMTIEEFASRYYTETYLYNGNLEKAGYVVIPAGMIGAEEDFKIKWTTQQSGSISDANINYVLKYWGNTIWFSGITGRIPDIGSAPNNLGTIYLYEPLPENYIQGELIWDDNTSPKTVSYKPCTQELRDPYAGISYMPKNPALLRVHKDRLCIVGDNEQQNCLFMSEMQNPFYYPTSLAFITPHTDPLNNLFVFDGSLVFGGKFHIYAIYGSSPLPESNYLFTMKEMDTTVGFMCFDCGDIIQNYYGFMGSDCNFHMLTTPTTNTEYLMVKDISRTVDLKQPPFEFGYFETCHCQAISTNNMLYFSIWANMENAILVYSYENMAWTYFTDWNAVYMYKVDKGNEIDFIASNFYIYKYITDVTNKTRRFSDYDTNADGDPDAEVPIKARVLTKRFTPYGNVKFKYVKQILLNTYPYTEANSRITTRVFVDNLRVDLGEVVSEQPRWGSAIWGQSRFATEGIYRSLWYGVDARGSNIAFEFTNEKLNQGMKIVNVNVLYKARDIR